MRKIFFMALFALIVSVQNFCGAATIEDGHSVYEENVIYPVVHTGDAAIDKKINSQIFAEVDRFVTMASKDAIHNRTRADVRMSYDVACNEAGGTVILSLILNESYYIEHMAHPWSGKRALNFNTASGELMGMDYLTEVGEGVSPDEFKSRIEKSLNDYCRHEGIFLFENALPLKELPENFYWDENLNIHFIFNHYEIAPYAAGIIDVKI